MIRLTLFLICLGTSVAAHKTPHIRVEFDGPKVTHHEGNAGIDTPFAIASVGKLFTSVAMLRLVEDGLLELDAPVANWLEDDVVAGFDGMNGITLRHLATMTSGLPDYYNSDFIDAAMDLPVADRTPAFAVSFAFDDDILFTAGTEFDYSNTNYVLIGMVMEDATGLPYADVIQQQVIDPLGMTGSFVFGSRPLPDNFTGGHEDGSHIRSYYTTQGYGDGGMISTTSDLALLYAALRNDELLSAQSLQTLRTDPVGAGYAMGLVIDGDYVGHTGGDLGFSSNVVMDTRTGRIAIELIGEGDADTSWPDTAID